MAAVNHQVLTDLARKASGGDEEAFNEIYRLTRDSAYFVAYSITHDEQDALDIVQEGYLKAWQGLKKMESPEICAAWLNRIMGNTAKNYVKQRRPQIFQPLEDGEDILGWQPERDSDYVPDAAMDTAETRRLIMAIVDDLPEDQRLCVLMYYYNDLDMHEIAAALEVPYKTVDSRLRYARRKISNGVEDLERRGTKLYGAAPIPLLIWLLRHVAGESSKRLPPVIFGSSTAAAGAAAAGTATAGGTLAGAAAGGGILAAVTLPKIVAAVVAAVIICGGSTAGIILARRAKPRLDETTVAAAAFVEGRLADEAFAFSVPPLPVFNESQTDDIGLSHGPGYASVPAAQVTASTGTRAQAISSTQSGKVQEPVSVATTAAGAAGSTSTVASKNSTSTAGFTTATTTTTKTSTTTTTAATASVSRYTVSYNANGGTGAPAAQTKIYDIPLTLSAATPSRAGYAFHGWATSAAAAAAQYQPGSQYNANTSVTLYAVWKTYQVTKTSFGVSIAYMSDVLSPDIVFEVGDGSMGYTTRIVDSLGYSIGESGEFNISCKLGTTIVHAVNGSVTFRLPVPDTHKGISGLDVTHRVAPGVFMTMSAWRDGDELVFTTNYI